LKKFGGPAAGPPAKATATYGETTPSKMYFGPVTKMKFNLTNLCYKRLKRVHG
jgi:hypothetical protein